MVGLGKQRLALCFDKATLKQDKDGNRSAKMRFALRLDPEVATSCPPEVQAAYEAVETRQNSICYVELEKEIKNVNLEFYSLPDSKSLSASFPCVDLTGLAVERTEQRSVPHLLFSVVIPLEESPKLRHWIVDALFSQLWVKVEAAQMSFVSPQAEGKEVRPN